MRRPGFELRRRLTSFAAVYFKSLIRLLWLTTLFATKVRRLGFEQRRDGPARSSPRCAGCDSPNSNPWIHTPGSRNRFRERGVVRRPGFEPIQDVPGCSLRCASGLRLVGFKSDCRIRSSRPFVAECAGRDSNPGHELGRLRLTRVRSPANPTGTPAPERLPRNLPSTSMTPYLYQSGQNRFTLRYGPCGSLA